MHTCTHSHIEQPAVLPSHGAWGGTEKLGHLFPERQREIYEWEKKLVSTSDGVRLGT